MSTTRSLNTHTRNPIAYVDSQRNQLPRFTPPTVSLGTRKLIDDPSVLAVAPKTICVVQEFAARAIRGRRTSIHDSSKPYQVLSDHDRLRRDPHFALRVFVDSHYSLRLSRSRFSTSSRQSESQIAGTRNGHAPSSCELSRQRDGEKCPRTLHILALRDGLVRPRAPGQGLQDPRLEPGGQPRRLPHKTATHAGRVSHCSARGGNRLR